MIKIVNAQVNNHWFYCYEYNYLAAIIILIIKILHVYYPKGSKP